MEDNNHYQIDKTKSQVATASWPVLWWALFLLLFVGSILVVFGFPFGPIAITTAIILLIFAYRAIYTAFYISIFFSLFLGITFSLSTGALKLGERAFGGSIDIFLGELFLLAVLTAWTIKILLLWLKRRDINWRPVLPVWKPYALFAFAHLVSVFSSYGPDPILIGKYVLRPVLFCYVAFIALPVNLIRSERRLRAILGLLAFVGILATINAYSSLLYIEPYSWAVRRAHPMPLFGINPIGDNHNLLAELLLITAPATLALAFITKKMRTARVLMAVAGMQIMASLLTFARSAWIVFACQTAFMLFTVWRSYVKKYLGVLLALIVLLIPLALYQVKFSFSPTATSSNSTRWMLTEIAKETFFEHPLIGSGAGTFIWRVGNAQVFIIEFGNPMEAHGFIQKLAAEVGLFGLLTYAFLLIMLWKFAWRGIKQISGKPNLVAHILFAGAFGAIIYQLFNTAYWTSHLWLPIGLLLATVEMYRLREAKTRNIEVFGQA